MLVKSYELITLYGVKNPIIEYERNNMGSKKWKGSNALHKGTLM